MRIVALGIGSIGLLWFATPLVVANIRNIGNVTGMMVAVLLIVYGIWMPQIHKGIRAFWKNGF